MRFKIYLLISLIFLTLCPACSYESDKSAKLTHAMSIKTKLKDNSILHMQFKLYFNDIKGIQDIQRHEKQFKYAISMVMLRQDQTLFSKKAKGKTRIVNVISSIAKQLLHEKVRGIKITNYYFS